jgi:hypothetical protein
MLNAFSRNHIIGCVLLIGLLIGIILMTGCASTNSDHGRFLEPARSGLYVRPLMMGVPVTLVECVEQELLKQGVKVPKAITKQTWEIAQKECARKLLPELKKEIEESMAAEEAAGAI